MMSCDHIEKFSRFFNGFAPSLGCAQVCTPAQLRELVATHGLMPDGGELSVAELIVALLPDASKAKAKGKAKPRATGGGGGVASLPKNTKTDCFPSGKRKHFLPGGGFSREEKKSVAAVPGTPPGLSPDAVQYYNDCVRRQTEMGYYSEADENLRVRYANELLFLSQLRAQADAGGYDALVQKSESGYEQRSALAMHIESCKASLLKHEQQLMLTPYQRKKGNTQGVHKKVEDDAPKSIDDLLGD